LFDIEPTFDCIELTKKEGFRAASDDVASCELTWDLSRKKVIPNLRRSFAPRRSDEKRIRLFAIIIVEWQLIDNLSFHSEAISKTWLVMITTRLFFIKKKALKNEDTAKSIHPVRYPYVDILDVCSVHCPNRVPCRIEYTFSFK
jgi:hypothetical protein